MTGKFTPTPRSATSRAFTASKTEARNVFRTMAGMLLPAVLALASTAAALPAHNESKDGNTNNPNASVIVFSPTTLALNNPVGSPALTRAASSQVTLDMTVYDSSGNVMQPSESNPLHVHVYGAPDGVITPIDSVITSGSSVTYTYNGASFPNNMEVAAWMHDPSTAGASLGTTLFIHANRPTCTYGTGTYSLNVTSNVPSEIQVKAVIGADNPTQGEFKTFTMDTGSLGVIVTKSSLIVGPHVHGPGAKGQKFYDSSGYVFSGNYYLAPVSVQLQDGSFVQTNPILVLAIDKVTCHAGYKNCVQPGRPDLHYLGVGFDRNTTGPGDLFDSPSENAFLELTDAQNGTDINMGYILSSSGLTVGLTSENTSGFNSVTLTRNPTVWGDFEPVPGCYQFTSLPGSPQYCGNLLLDVGIPEMFIDLAFQNRPAGSYGSNNRVPDGLGMKIQAGLSTGPAMSYTFNAVQPPQLPTGDAPTYAEWVNSGTIFVNTGRRPLLDFDYFYSGQCGVAGFKHN